MGAGHRPGIKAKPLPRSTAQRPISMMSSIGERIEQLGKGQVIDNNGLREMLRASIFAQLDPLRPSPDVSRAIGERSEDLYLCRSLPLIGMCKRLNMSSAGGCELFNGSIEISATTWLSVLVKLNRLTSPSRLSLSIVSNTPLPSRLSLSIVSNIPS